MLTNPSTLGLFETGIEEIERIVHGVGATLYYDGANLNAIMGICRPGGMGFDIVHFNLHKSFTQPHGGGGPGAGPIAVSESIEPFLPRPLVIRTERTGDGAGPFYDLDYDRPKSIGRLRGFQGNYGVFVRAYAYIRSLGAAGLRDVSEVAVLNANYLLARMRREGVLEYLPAAQERLGMQEFVRAAAAAIAARAERELEALVAVSTPSGEVHGADEALALCAALLPAEAEVQRIPCSTPDSAPDLLARVRGTGKHRLLLLGHI